MFFFIRAGYLTRFDDLRMISVVEMVEKVEMVVVVVVSLVEW